MRSQADRAGSVPTERQDEAIRQLIALGEEHGTLLHEEIEAVLRADVTDSSVLDDLRANCEDAGIEVVGISVRPACARAPSAHERRRARRPT